MKPACKRPAEDLEEGGPGGTPGLPAVRAKAAANKQLRRPRVEGWDERLMVGLAIVLAVIVVVVTVYQTIGWAQS